MSNFQSNLNKIRESMKSLLNDSNVQTITSISKQIDELEAEHAKQEEELSKTKSTLIDYVKEYSFKEPPKKAVEEEQEPLTLDEAIQAAITKASENKNKK